MMTARRMIVALALGLLPLSLCGADMPGETDTRGFMYGRCYKAHPGKVTELREFFDTVGRTLGEEAVKAGKMGAYSVIEARVPRGRDSMCDFIATNRYVGYPSNLQLGTDAALKRLRMDQEQIGAKLGAAGYLVKSTLSQVVGSAGIAKEDAIVSLQTHHVPSRTAYEQMVETEIQAVAQARVDTGQTLGWGASIVAQPRGSDQDFNASSYTVFEDMVAQGRRTDWVSLYAKAAPGKSWEDFLSRLREARERVDSGVYVVRVLVAAK